MDVGDEAGERGLELVSDHAQERLHARVGDPQRTLLGTCGVALAAQLLLFQEHDRRPQRGQQQQGDTHRFRGVEAAGLGDVSPAWTMITRPPPPPRRQAR